MNPYLIVSIVLAVIVAALVIYIIADKIKRKKEIDELIDFLTKVQDRDTFPELGMEAEGKMLILRSEIYKLASTLQEQYAGEVKKNTYKADMLSNISHQIKTPLTAINLMTDALKSSNIILTRWTITMNSIISNVKWSIHYFLMHILQLLKLICFFKSISS